VLQGGQSTQEGDPRVATRIKQISLQIVEGKYYMYTRIHSWSVWFLNVETFRYYISHCWYYIMTLARVETTPRVDTVSHLTRSVKQQSRLNLQLKRKRSQERLCDYINYVKKREKKKKKKSMRRSMGDLEGPDECPEQNQIPESGGRNSRLFQSVLRRVYNNKSRSCNTREAVCING